MKINRANNSKKQGLRRKEQGPMVCIYGTKRRRTKANRHTTITSFAEAGETVAIADDDEPTVHIEILPPLCF
jgi:hypothetical protein